MYYAEKLVQLLGLCISYFIQSSLIKEIRDTADPEIGSHGDVTSPLRYSIVLP